MEGLALTGGECRAGVRPDAANLPYSDYRVTAMNTHDETIRPIHTAANTSQADSHPATDAARADTGADTPVTTRSSSKRTATRAAAASGLILASSVALGMAQPPAIVSAPPDPAPTPSAPSAAAVERALRLLEDYGIAPAMRAAQDPIESAQWANWSNWQNY